MVRMARSNSRRFFSPVSASVEASAASSIAAAWIAVSARTRSMNRPRWLQIAGHRGHSDPVRLHRRLSEDNENPNQTLLASDGEGHRAVNVGGSSLGNAAAPPIGDHRCSRRSAAGLYDPADERWTRAQPQGLSFRFKGNDQWCSV